MNMDQQPVTKSRFARLAKKVKHLKLILLLLIAAVVILPPYIFMRSTMVALNNLKQPVVYASPQMAKVDHGNLGWWASLRRDWKVYTGRFDNFQARDDAYRPVVGVIVEGDKYVYQASTRAYVRTSLLTP
jgi:hypothetical protein